MNYVMHMFRFLRGAFSIVGISMSLGFLLFRGPVTPSPSLISRVACGEGGTEKGFVLFDPPAGKAWMAQIGAGIPYVVTSDTKGNRLVRLPEGAKTVNFYYSDGEGWMSQPTIAVVDW